MFSPKVEQSIAAKFQSGQKDEIDLKLKMEMLAEEQERAIDYLKSGPRMRIQELGKTKRDNITVGVADPNKSLKKIYSRNLAHPKSLPRLKEETSLGDLSLK